MRTPNAALEAQVDRLTTVLNRIRLFAHQRHLTLEDAGDEAVRQRMVDREDWHLLLLIRRAVGCTVHGTA